MLANELAETIDLDGAWQFSLGDGSAWGTIQAPGCWEAQGYSCYPDGPARYRRSLPIPSGWAGKRIAAEFDAVSYACTVFCNGVEVGRHVGLWTPFAVDLSAAARPGEENLLEVEVYKPGERYPVRSSLAGFLPDVATTFGGLWQPARLRAYTHALDGVDIRADYATRSVAVRARAAAFDRPAAGLTWKVEAYQDGRRLAETGGAPEAAPGAGEGWIEARLDLPGAALWSPERPALCTVRLTLLDGERPVARVTRRTGFRQLSAAGDRLLLNGRPFLVRGILSWGWEPDRVAPVYTAEQARAEIRKAKAMGFNLVKLCLFVPNPAYFDAADEEGMLLWEELPMWLPEVNPALRAQAPAEYAEIARLVSHHPAVALYSLGCELNRSVDGALLGELNEAVRGVARDVLVCDNSGSGESYGGLDFDFADFTDYHPYYDLHFFEPLLDHWRRDWQAPRPWIFGEFCDSDTFRDLNEIIQANGGERPWWLTHDNPVTTWRPEAKAVLEWAERLEQARPGFSLEEITQVSYRQSYVIRKFTLEALRRRRGIGGYVVTGLRDTPISTSGVWDDFGRAKWPEEDFRRINGEAVLALDGTRRRTWRYGGDRPDPVDLYNHWAGDLARWYVILHDAGRGFPASSRLEWQLTGPAGDVLASGSETCAETVLPGAPVRVGNISVTLPEVARPEALTLEARLTGGRREARNRWPVWVYPRLGPPPRGLGVYDPSGLLAAAGDWLAPVPRLGFAPGEDTHRLCVATLLDPQALRFVEAGGRVLLLQQGEGPLPARRCPFWREAIKLFPPHPLWDAFPQQGFTDLQFYGLAGDLAFDTPRLEAALPPGARIRPILRRLDAREFHMSEYLFEAQIGAGVLLGCTLRLQGAAGNQPSGWKRNVAGGALLQALLRYLDR